MPVRANRIFPKVRDSHKVSAKVRESRVSRPYASRAALLRLGLEREVFPKVSPKVSDSRAPGLAPVPGA